MKISHYGAILALLPTILICSRLSAMPAADVTVRLQQPTGELVEARAAGDEWNNRMETRAGYTIARDAGKVWRYVTRFNQSGKPELSGSRAEFRPPPGLTKHIKSRRARPLGAPPKGFVPLRSAAGRGAGESSGESGSAPALGPVLATSTPVLFILAEFTDRQGETAASTWSEFLSDNIADYYHHTSHGNASLTQASESSASGNGAANDGIVGWVNLGYEHPDTRGSTGNVNRTLAADAIAAANPYVDFSSYDSNSDGYLDGDELSIVVIAAGYETAYGGASGACTPGVWGHKWSWWTTSGSNPYPQVDGVRIKAYAQFGELHASGGCSNEHVATMGIMVHELGHLTYGLPDLYDTDGSSGGIGAFGLMGGGSWGRSSTQNWSGETPVNAGAWSKYVMNWAEGAEGSGVQSVVASGSGTANDTVFRASTPSGQQYFLVENRQPVGYDLGLEGYLGTNFTGGLAIWHIDETQTSNANDGNRLVDIEEADGSDMTSGERGSSSDLWRGVSGAAFDFYSFPNSQLHSNADSGVTLSDISAAGDTMTLAFGNQGSGVGVLDHRITASLDDVEESKANGSIQVASGDLEFGFDEWAEVSAQQYLGLRFQSLDIPQGALITSAYLLFTVDETGSVTTDAQIRAEASDSAPAFTGAAYEVSNRAITASVVGWSIPAWNSVGNTHQTPDLSTVVQEVVDRPGWSAGGNIAFRIDGAGDRTAVSYDGSPADAPLLHIEYDTSPQPPNQGPAADAGPDLSIADTDGLAGETAALDGSGSSDSDGSIQSYFWTWSGGSASGVTPNVSLPDSSTTVTLTVTDNDGAVASDTVIVNVAAAPPPNILPVADAGLDQTITDTDGSDGERITLDGSGSFDSDGVIDSYSWSWAGGLVSGLNPTVNLNNGTTAITLTVTDDEGGIDTDTVSITIQAPVSSETQPRLYTGTVNGVGSADWTQVTLPESYDSMVVVATLSYDSSSSPPALARVQNAAGNRFEVMAVNPSGAALSGLSVHYVVVEEGVFTISEHGISMEAVKFTSTVTDFRSGWIGEGRSYANTYASPVVLGQVMSANDPAWSVFWASGDTRTGPPSAGALRVGKHVGEDPQRTRANETIGYIVIESGSGTVNGVSYSAALGSDLVRGPGNGGPYSYPIAASQTPTVAILSAAAMDGNDGGWPLLAEPALLSESAFSLWFDEDQLNDTERSHTTEQVAYLVASQAGETTNQPPGAGFTIAVDALTVTFTDTSSDSDGSISSWHWEFGDGNSSSVQHPSHSYSEDGSYRVQLTVTDDEGATSVQNLLVTVAMTAVNPPPSASFSYVENNLAVQFTDTSTDDKTIVGWSWEFGDGQVSAAQHPNHSYASAGSYTVTLIATDNEGASNPTSAIISVDAPVPPNDPPVAGFSHVVEGLSAQFNNTSTDSDGTVVSWSWDFGDGSFDNGPNPTHIYASAGNYFVTLEVRDDDGASATITTSVSVNDAPSQPIEVFFDSFENGQWNGLWSEDASNDWTHGTERRTEGSTAARVDGRATDAELTSMLIDLQGRSQATITFNWLIESGLDSGEYLAFDLSTDGGNNWTELASLRGNLDTENTWHTERFTLNVQDMPSLRLRFRGTMSHRNEQADLDEIRVVLE